jgi:hypothetical protein
MAKVFGVVEPTEEGLIPVRTKGQRQILQTLLYCWLIADSTSSTPYTHPTSYGEASNITPYIYSARLIALEDVPAVMYDNVPLVFDAKIKQEFIAELTKLLDEIFDSSRSFVPTNDSYICASCAFSQLCQG